IIGARQHELFRDDRFLTELAAEDLHPQLILLAGDDSDAHEANHLGNWLQAPDDGIIPPMLAPTAADEVAFFQLSGG
ncbi:2,3-dihydroxybenzoate-AMP ligase, partial [Ochrobactrum sp. MR34]|nr:2,3-dihydroxybenzoate-AMP ligase [Ochrobactrum sp. MR34]